MYSFILSSSYSETCCFTSKLCYFTLCPLQRLFMCLLDSAGPRRDLYAAVLTTSHHCENWPFFHLPSFNQLSVHKRISPLTWQQFSFFKSIRYGPAQKLFGKLNSIYWLNCHFPYALWLLQSTLIDIRDMTCFSKSCTESSPLYVARCLAICQAWKPDSVVLQIPLQAL